MKFFLLAQYSNRDTIGVKEELVRAIENSTLGQALGIVLPIILAVGFVIVLCIRQFDVSMSRPLQRLIWRYFVLILIAYLLWFGHFFVGVPFFSSIEMEYGLLLGGGSGFFLLLYFVETYREKERSFNPKEDIHCPKCGAIMLKIAAKCPQCGKNVD